MCDEEKKEFVEVKIEEEQKNEQKVENTEEVIEKLKSERDMMKKRINELENDLEVIKKEKEELKEATARLKADFFNYRRRQEEERARYRDTIVTDVLASLLPVIDNMDRALDVDNCSDVEAVKKGVRMVRQQFISKLYEQGFEDMVCIGKPFDPVLHDAVEVEHVIGAEDGIILLEVTKGYMYKGRVVRPARVKVSKSKE